MKLDKAAVALVAGAIGAAIISFLETYFVAPPLMPASLYNFIAFSVAGFSVALAVGHAWLIAGGTLAGQIGYFLSTSEILPLHPILIVGLAFMVLYSLIALLGAWLGQALARRRSAI